MVYAPVRQDMRIGIDLGGTKIEALALDDDGHERLRRRVATPSRSCGAIVKAIAELVCGFEKELAEPATVGVATPGAISPASGLIKNSNTVCLNGQPLQRMLSEALAREVRLANDANCFALSEAVDGAGASGHIVFGVIIGTGTGGGVVVGRRLVAGANAIAGEWGHNPLPWAAAEDEPPPQCYCGKRGCLETYLSGPGLARDHAAKTGEQLNAVEIAKRAQQGDGRAAETIERYVRRLGKGLASVMNVLDPDVVVLGGGVSNIEALYEALPNELGRWAFSDAICTSVVQAQHGDSSGVRGAAWLW